MYIKTSNLELNNDCKIHTDVPFYIFTYRNQIEH